MKIEQKSYLCDVAEMMMDSLDAPSNKRIAFITTNINTNAMIGILFGDYNLDCKYIEYYRNEHTDYVIEINKNDEIIIIPTYDSVEGYYFPREASVIYVDNDINSKYYSHLESVIEEDSIYLIGIEIDNYDEFDSCCDYACGLCEALELAEDIHDEDQLINTDDNMHGFTQSVSDEHGHSSISFYSADKDLVEHVVKHGFVK